MKDKKQILTPDQRKEQQLINLLPIAALHFNKLPLEDMIDYLDYFDESIEVQPDASASTIFSNAMDVVRTSATMEIKDKEEIISNIPANEIAETEKIWNGLLSEYCVEISLKKPIMGKKKYLLRYAKDRGFGYESELQENVSDFDILRLKFWQKYHLKGD